MVDMGHICMLMTIPGSMMSSHTDGRIIAWCPSRPRLSSGVPDGGDGGGGESVGCTVAGGGASNGGGGFEVDGGKAAMAAVVRGGAMPSDILAGTVGWWG